MPVFSCTNCCAHYGLTAEVARRTACPKCHGALVSDAPEPPAPPALVTVAPNLRPGAGVLALFIWGPMLLWAFAHLALLESGISAQPGAPQQAAFAAYRAAAIVGAYAVAR